MTDYSNDALTRLIEYIRDDGRPLTPTSYGALPRRLGAGVLLAHAGRRHRARHAEGGGTMTKAELLQKAILRSRTDLERALTPDGVLLRILASEQVGEQIRELDRDQMLYLAKRLREHDREALAKSLETWAKLYGRETP